MAAETAEVPWDDQTDQFLLAIDQLTKEKNGTSIRDLLLNPYKYAGNKDIKKTVDSIKSAVSGYFGEMLESMDDEVKKVVQELESCDVQYRKIDDVVSSKSYSLKVPYLKPTAVQINPDLREEIVIDQYNEKTDALIGKLISNSTYVADVSGTYNGHTLGSWLFSSDKPYLLTIKPPVSTVLIVERSKDNILGLLDSVATGS